MNEAQQIMGATQHKLVKPITAHKVEVHEVTLRRPTTAECKVVGRLPYVLTGGNMPSPDLAAVSKYLVVCLAIPESSVDQLDLVDLNELAWALVGFFLSVESKASAS